MPDDKSQESEVTLKSVGVEWRTSGTSRTMRKEAQRCSGSRDVNIQTAEDGDTCRIIYYKVRVLKNSAYQIFRRSFTTELLSIILEHNIDNNCSHGYWALSHSHQPWN